VKNTISQEVDTLFVCITNFLDVKNMHACLVETLYFSVELVVGKSDGFHCASVNIALQAVKIKNPDFIGFFQQKQG
jgi:hypothetical protein